MKSATPATASPMAVHTRRGMGTPCSPCARGTISVVSWIRKAPCAAEVRERPYLAGSGLGSG